MIARSGMKYFRLPNEGVGLARLEFIIARMIGVHPHAGIPWRVTLYLRQLQKVIRTRMPRDEKSARRDGARAQCFASSVPLSYCAVCLIGNTHSAQ